MADFQLAMFDYQRVWETHLILLMRLEKPPFFNREVLKGKKTMFHMRITTKLRVYMCSKKRDLLMINGLI
jgi:hypothetical protein